MRAPLIKRHSSRRLASVPNLLGLSSTENHCWRTLFDRALIPDPNSEFGASAHPKIALDALLPTLDGS
jgi:hypothetical protein